MLKTALKLLKKIENSGYEAYIVGGYVRDYILGLDSIDVDITTNATPMEIKKIFKDICLPNEEYGSVKIIIKNIHFEITTYRKEYTYLNNRKPIEIEYISDLVEDLKRRDFTINTLCMDSSGRILDLLGGLKDIDKKVIDTVGDSVYKFEEDALRILRAVRFATVLNFTLKDNVKSAIIRTKNYLKNISYERKKQELEKIFSSSNAQYGVNLLIELGLDSVLEIYNLADIKLGSDIIGIWSSLKVSENYPFTSNEKNMMNKINEAMLCDNLDDMVLYKYGSYVNSIAASMKGIDRKEIIKRFNKLPITNVHDIEINGNEIMMILNRNGGPYIRQIYNDLEKKILIGEIKNKNKAIREYIVANYK